MQWWTERSPREKLLLGVAGGLGVLIILYQFLFVPLTAYRADAVRDYQRSDALLTEMRAGAAEASALKTVAERRIRRSDQPLRVTVTASAHQAGVTITRIEPARDGGLSVWIEEVGAQPLHRWIKDLHADHGIAVSKASIHRHEDRPLVRAQIQFAGSEGS